MRTIIPIGPYHPLLEEPEFFKLVVEGETVVDMDIRIGWNHRGIEKIAEGKTYDQVLFLVERICGICSTSHPIANVLAQEDLAGAEVPERAQYIRSIVAELERLHSHLLWLGLAGHFIGYNTVFMWVWKAREPILDLFELITGNRNDYAMLRPGGVRRDIYKKDLPAIRKVMDELEPANEMFTKAILDDPVLSARLKGVGVLTKEDAVRYCVLGPTARASGVDIDVRRDEPYAAYDKVEWKVVVQEGGDVLAKAVVRLLENFESIKIIRQCVDRLGELPEGDIWNPIPQMPVGEGIGHEEAPRGECLHYIRSDGGNYPLRVKVRAPTYNNLPSFKASCLGETVSDVALITAGIDPCYCCTERMATVYDSSNKKVYDWQDLVRLSQEKTEKIRKEVGR